MKAGFKPFGSEITKHKFDPQTLAAAVLAVAGVGFLELAGSQQFVIGQAHHSPGGWKPLIFRGSVVGLFSPDTAADSGR